MARIDLEELRDELGVVTARQGRLFEGFAPFCDVGSRVTTASDVAAVAAAMHLAASSVRSAKIERFLRASLVEPFDAMNTIVVDLPGSKEIELVEPPFSGRLVKGRAPVVFDPATLLERLGLAG